MMSDRVFKINDPDEYRKAGTTDLVELAAPPGGNALFVMKWVVESLVYGIANHEFIHLSGPTGSAKSSVIEGLYRVPDNFTAACSALGFAPKPLKLYAVEMATYETPGELYQRRSLKDGSTFDELSRLVQSIEDAASSGREYYPLIWLREMGRVHSSSVQGGLLNLMTRGDVLLPDGRRIPGDGIAWIADSNYQAERDSTHTLVTLDDALKRRFSMNLTLDYLSAEQEAQVLSHLAGNGAGIEPVEEDLITKVVKLGHVIRRYRAEGNLQSLTPPTVYGYLAFLRMAGAMPHLSLQQVAIATLLGNAAVDDLKVVPGVFNEVFGLKSAESDDPAGSGLF
jgi:hypothetical protein